MTPKNDHFGVARSFLLSPYRRFKAWNKRRTTDIFVIGYPRSGNTWAKFLLGRYVQLLCESDEMPLFNEYDILGRCKRTCLEQTINSSHGGLNWETLTENAIDPRRYIDPYLGKKVVLLTRYPLDSLISNWIYYTRLSFSFQMDLVPFLEDPRHSLTKWISYHNLWAARRDVFGDKLLLVRHEDLRSRTEEEFLRLLNFMKLPLIETFVQQAIEFANLGNMKKMQEAGHVPGRSSGERQVIRVGDPKDPESSHVRRGNVGGYRDYLSANDAQQYERRITEEANPWFGYDRPPSLRL